MKANLYSAIVIAVFLALTARADASSIKKEFEFGTGTANPASVKVDFRVPCKVDGLNFKIEFERKGPTGSSNDIPIALELRLPATTPGGVQILGPQKETEATVNRRTWTFGGSAIDRGCDLFWSVRVRPQSGTAKYAVVGAITASWSDSQKAISIEGNQITLNEGNSVMKNLGTGSGLPQGRVRIVAQWGTIAYPATQMGKLKIEIIDPQGQVVASQTGHPTSSTFSPRIDLKYLVASCSPGQWKVRFTNNSDFKINEMVPTASLSPDCP